jgi:carboxyl-terminal processing protease
MLLKMSKNSRNLLLLAVGMILGLSLGLAHGVLADKPAALGKDLPWQDARLLAEVLERVEREYVDPVDDHQLLQAAIRGMVSSLDPYSAYLDGEEYDEIKISSSGQYSGVGIEVSMEDGQVVVVAPFDGSPAAAAGIRSGDVIATIDGVAVNTTTLADTIGRMRGKEGTSVKIGVLREGSTEPLVFTLKRSRVQLHSVKAELPEAGFGYVRIAQFSETTAGELTEALRTLRKNNGAPLKGLVLDLRNNPGGVLEAAVAVADSFLDGGVIVSAKGRTPESKFEMRATPGDDLSGAPIVVLVNGGSASAAEIVAGALKDNHRATLMGRTTFGKGSVQTVMPLSGDRGIKLTTSLYYTPSGVSINHRGIAPDIELERDQKPPLVDVPGAPAPGAAVPGAAAPRAPAPGTAAPGAAAPRTPAPGAAVPGAAAPRNPAPGAPGTTAPPADLPLLERDPEVKRAIQELKVPTVGGRGSVAARNQ